MIFSKIKEAFSKGITSIFKSHEDIDEIILCGFVSSICVISNALLLRAKFPNKNVTIYDNLCADLDDNGHNSAMTVAHNCQIDIKSYTQKSN